MDDNNYIPFHRPYITEEEISGVVDSLRSGWLTMGPKTLEFEKEFASFVGSLHAIAVSSCTAALHLALKAVGVGPGDEVIVPGMTFTSTAEAVCYLGATPVVVDIDPDTLNMDVAAFERAVTVKTRAVMPVHYGGQPCDMDEITAVAREHGLQVIEDAAHAFPAQYKGRMVGSIGDITCFSFYVTKTLCTGEGGMLATEDPDWAGTVARLRLHGISKDAWKRYEKGEHWRYDVTELGYKYNMTDIQAALGLAQLKKAQWMRTEREKIANRYNAALAGIEEIQLPVLRADRVSAWHLYPIRFRPGALKAHRDFFISHLNQLGIGTSVHFIPLHKHSFYKGRFGLKDSSFPHCTAAFDTLLSLPIYPGLSEADVDRVAGSLAEAVKEQRK